MSKTYAIILAGGKGLRLGGEIPKQFLPLGEKTVILRTIDVFNRLDVIDGIIAVIPGEYTGIFSGETEGDEYLKIIKTVAGGRTRQESACNALNSHDFKGDDILVFHDAARPFVTEDNITRLIEAVKECGCAGTYVNAIDTIADVDAGFIRGIPDRKRLYYTQTPQGFRYSIIREAHEKALASGVSDSTDDVSLVLKTGCRVKAVTGDYDNFKITTENDYKFALQLINL